MADGNNSASGEFAAHILKLIAQGTVVPVREQIRLRYLAHRDEVTLPLEALARRILEREKEST